MSLDEAAEMRKERNDLHVAVRKLTNRVPELERTVAEVEAEHDGLPEARVPEDMNKCLNK